MKAVRLNEPGGRLTLKEIPVPHPTVGQVLVRMAAAPINPSDLGMLRKAGERNGEALPLTPGIEGCGTVVAAGEGLLGAFLKGRRVACASRTGGGSWAEYLVTSVRSCIPLKKRVPWEQAAMLIVNPLSALAFIEVARHGKHRAIVNTAAASALGGMLLRLGKYYNLPVIHVVRREDQAELVRQRGGEHVLNSNGPDFGEQLGALAARLEATLFLDAIGGEMTGRLAGAAPFGSTVLIYAGLSRQKSSIDPSLAQAKNLRFEGWYLPNWMRHKNLLQTLLFTSKAQDLLGSELHSPIRSCLPLAEAQQGLEIYTENMTAGKILLVADSDAVSTDV